MQRKRKYWQLCPSPLKSDSLGPETPTSDGYTRSPVSTSTQHTGTPESKIQKLKKNNTTFVVARIGGSPEGHDINMCH